MVDQACLFTSTELKLSEFLPVCCGLGLLCMFFCLVVFLIIPLILAIPHAHAGNLLFQVLNCVKNLRI